MTNIEKEKFRNWYEGENLNAKISRKKDATSRPQKRPEGSKSNKKYL